MSISVLAVDQLNDSLGNPLISPNGGPNAWDAAVRLVDAKASAALAAVKSGTAGAPGTAAPTVVWVTTKTGNYTAASGEGVPFDNTLTANALTLPPAPTYGDEVWFKDATGMFATNMLTIIRNGNLLMGLSQDSTVSTNNIRAGVRFYGTPIGWRFIL